MSFDTLRLARLLARLPELEHREVADHERSIHAASCAFLREAVRELSRRLHALDYWHRRLDGWNGWNGRGEWNGPNGNGPNGNGRNGNGRNGWTGRSGAA